MSATYELGPAALFVQERYIGKLRQKNFGNPTGIYAYPVVGSVFYTDVTATWKIGEEGKYQLYATVNNLFDRKPPLFPSPLPFPGFSYPADMLTYDIEGRYFTIGARAKF